MINVKPFSARREDDVLTLVLDTPGSDVNILSVAAASQLLEILGASESRSVRALVLRSAKPASFLNGVGLLMAGMAQVPEDSFRVSAVVRRAYRALRDFPVPTVAVIRGNCYGCGVELSLQCDYRFAADTCETHFYMTEIADYLFVPVFGGTQDLPRLLGLPAATDFLLWGERWSARQAAQRGLIDGCFDRAELDAEVLRRLPTLSAKRPLPDASPWTADLDRFVARTEARITALPPAYHEVYRDCFELLSRAARKGRPNDDDYDREIAACGRSAIQPISKSAMSFFFIRQLALETALRSYELPPGTTLIIPNGHRQLDELRSDLIARNVTDVEILSAPLGAEECPSRLKLLLVPHGTCVPGAIGVALQALAPPVRRGGLLCYAPSLHAGNRLVEIAGDGAPDNRAKAMYAVLNRAGFVPIFSHSGRTLAINDLCAAFLAPLLGFVLSGRSPEDAHATLREFGFARLASFLVRAMRAPAAAAVDDCAPSAYSDPDALAVILVGAVSGSPSFARVDAALHATAESTFEGGTFDQDLLDAVIASLFEVAVRLLDERVLGHPSVVDLMARELLDFPLAHGSLCRYLTSEVTAGVIARRSGFAHLVAAERTARAEGFVRDRRTFYQQRSRPRVPHLSAEAGREREAPNGTASRGGG